MKVNIVNLRHKASVPQLYQHPDAVRSLLLLGTMNSNVPFEENVVDPLRKHSLVETMEKGKAWKNVGRHHHGQRARTGDLCLRAAMLFLFFYYYLKDSPKAEA